MERYDYFTAVLEDVKNYIKSEINFSDYSDAEDLEQYLNDELFLNDSVTGNASGSYTFNAWEAEENLCHNMDLLQEALSEFGCGLEYLERGAEACDVTIRCYLLGQAIADAVDALWEDSEESADLEEITEELNTQVETLKALVSKESELETINK